MIMQKCLILQRDDDFFEKKAVFYANIHESECITGFVMKTYHKKKDWLSRKLSDNEILPV